MSTKLVSLDALQFNVAGLLKGPIGDTRSYDIRVPVSEMDRIDESFDVTGPFEGAVRFLRTPHTVLVMVNGELGVRQDCSRCLDRFDTPIEIDIEEEFHPTVDISTGRLLGDTGDDNALVIDEQHILDLTEVMRQTAILALPITPICRNDCAGLCPICGANRNVESCTCIDTAIDPRWEALGVLIEADENAS